MWLIALSHALTAAALLPWVIVWGDAPSPIQWVQLAGFGVFQMAVPYLLVARGVRSIPGHEASGITLIEPLLVPLWVWWAWHGEPGQQATAWWTYLGGGLIFLGLVARYAPASLFASRS
jgi:drug/metabolite transporter (DMT)-like permease